MINKETLTDTIKDLIYSEREDDWWDFKAEHHKDKAALMHDIVCMANNCANRDALIIFGVENSSFEIVGVENDPNRRNQQNITCILKTAYFAGGVRPRIEMHTINIGCHDVDVLVIKNTFDVPYYLEKDYYDKQYKTENPNNYKTVRAFHIYTRRVDNNTDIDKSADINDIEYLWKKRLGMMDTPMELVFKLLSKPDEWVYEDGTYYHRLHPEFTVKNIYDYEVNEDNDYDFKEHYVPASYHYEQMDTNAHYGIISIYHYSTKLFSCQSSDLDGYRALIPTPDWKAVSFSNEYGDTISIRYYTSDSIEYRLLDFFKEVYDKDNGNEASIAVNRLFDVVFLFENEDTLHEFIQFASHFKGKYLQFCESFDRQLYEEANVPKHEIQRLIEAYFMKEIFGEWIKNYYQ